jgi:hypothetical protein
MYLCKTIAFCGTGVDTFSMSYSDSVRAILPSELRRLFLRLRSPVKIQNYLDSLPVNFELTGESNFSPRDVFHQKTAHCFEGAVFAAAALAFHGERPLLMDFATAYNDEDHTIALFRKNGYWGAISKTNHAIIKYRDPVYDSPRELAMSYFHEYFMHDGRKSLRGYSRPFDLSKYSPQKWITSGESLDWLMAALSRTRYFPIAPEKNMRALTRASDIECAALRIQCYSRDGKKIDPSRVRI